MKFRLPSFLRRDAAPAPAERREPVIRTVPARRAFTSAQSSDLVFGWTTQPKPIDVDIRNGLRALKARARQEAQNNDHVRRFLGLIKTNVVGHQGIQLQARVVDPNGEQDKLANDAIEDGWREWGRKGSCDVTGRLSWKMAQRLFIETLARDGEVLIRKVRGWGGNRYRFALQFLDSELLDVSYNDELANGHVIRMGVELDAWRRPVAYHLLSSSSTADSYYSHGKRYIRVPAEEIIHEFLPEWVWQTRGFPWLASALLRLNMLSGFEEAELVASRWAASKFAAYERVDDEGDLNIAGQDGIQRGADGEFLQEIDVGTIGINPDGYKLTFYDPQHPNNAFGDFIKACLRGIAGGLGVSYNDLANDLEGVNYSSLRHASLQDRAVWMALQDWMIEAFCDVVYREWLGISLLAQVLQVAGKPLKLEREEKYQRVVWQPRRWQWVDPQKEMGAHELAFRHRIRSPQGVIREMGEDPETVLDEWAQWQRMLAERQLTQIDAGPAPASSQTEPANGNQENPEE